MKKHLFFIIALGMGLSSEKISAQTVDQTFAAPIMYAPGSVNSALQQPDGKVVITGYYTRINGSSATSMSRFNTNGTLDAAFQQNIGNNATGAYRARLLANGQFMLGYSTGQPFTMGGITRQTMLRLNADGTGDAIFDIGSGPAYGTSISYVDDYYSLANGQTIAVGGWDHFNGAVVSKGIVRLTATGAVDPSFNAGTGADVNDDIESIVALPNGQYLIGGFLTTYNGIASNGIARLNADGSLDRSFTSRLAAYDEVSNIVVQPNGYIMISGFFTSPSGTGYQSIARLQPNGSFDTSFAPPAGVAQGNIYSYSGNSMQVQPDGKVLVIGSNVAGANGTVRVVRLNTDGTLDNTFQTSGPNALPRSITLLANGNVAVVGSFTNFNGVRDRPYIELTSTGAMASATPPVIQTGGAVTATVRQADGKIVVGGNFSEINGQAVSRLARFNTNGTLDAAYIASTGYDGAVQDLTIQPDGDLLVAAPGFLQRYFPSGAPDLGFTASFSSSAIRILLQADGRILVGSTSLATPSGTVTPGFMRLNADGSRDNTFAPNSTGAGRFTAFTGFAQQPDGKILVAGRYAATSGTTTIRTLMRLNANGAVDASFAGASILGGNTSALTSIAVQSTGRIVVGGSFTSYGGTARLSVVGLNPDGTLDAGFVPVDLTGTVNKVLIQPNGRILLGGLFGGVGLPNNLARLLNTGAADASYAATAVPNSTVNSLLIQPDGKIVAGGSFTTVGGQASQTIVRITATNVLHVAAPQAVADRTEAWPVPAHASLNVVPDVSAHPQAVELLDLLGRSVLLQQLAGAAPAVLSVENLRAGTYLLRITYAEGLVTRRIQVQ